MALVRTDVSEELSASFIRVTIIGELVKADEMDKTRRTNGEKKAYVYVVGLEVRKT
jgi:hypothetical protein